MAPKPTDIVKSIIGYDSIVALTINIPQGLYYYSPKLSNGNEDVLEGKHILIELQGHDVRDTRSHTIVIRESADDTLLSVISDNIQFEIEMSYQLARQFILELIALSEPHSVNLISR